MKKQAKRLKMVVCVNSLVSTRHQAYSNHCQFWFRLGRVFPEFDFTFFNPDRMSIDRCRNQAAETALQIEADYLLFLDDDVIVPMDGLRRLLDADKDVVAGDVCIRGYPFDHMLFKWVDKAKTGLKALAKLPKTRGLLEVGAVGFSFCLIKVGLLKEMSKPYFVTGLSNTEDIYFCVKAQQEKPEVSIFADTRVICPHILWEETISSLNKKEFKKYYEDLNPSLKQPTSSEDRGDVFVQKLKEQLG